MQVLHLLHHCGVAIPKAWRYAFITLVDGVGVVVEEEAVVVVVVWASTFYKYDILHRRNLQNINGISSRSLQVQHWPGQPRRFGCLRILVSTPLRKTFQRRHHYCLHQCLRSRWTVR
jgi:hypothetical protein